MKVLGVVASAPGGSTDRLVQSVLEGAAAAGAEVETLHLGHGPYDPAAGAHGLTSIAPFNALVLGTPMYRATYAGVLKSFLDDVPRGGPADDFASPLLARPVALVATGASDHHFLGIDPLLALLVRFFAAWIVPPCLYARSEQVDALGERAQALGRTTAALAEVLGFDHRLNGRRPQA